MRRGRRRRKAECVDVFFRLHVKIAPPSYLQLLDELDAEIEGTSTRLAAAQKKVQYVLDKAGTKGQFLIILFLIVVLVVLIVLAIG